MLNIKEEINICLLKRGLSMRKLAKILRDKGYNIPQSSGLSDSINKKRVRFETVNKKRVRFETVQEILDYLGFELVVREKRKSEN